MSDAQIDPSVRLLDRVPSTGYRGLIALQRGQTPEYYAASYHEAAQRLAHSFAGKPQDDLMLLPFLSLYRQAFELQIKVTLSDLYDYRLRFVEGKTPRLREPTTESKLRNMRHDLGRLTKELEKELADLGFHSLLAPTAKQLILDLDETDQRGTAFRYAGELADSQAHADFPALAELLNQEFGNLSAVALAIEADSEARIQSA